MKLLFFFITLLTLPAMGGENHTHDDTSHGNVANIKEATRTIEVILYDNYYEPEVINIQANEIIRFIIKNKGQLVHEFNIGSPQMHAAHKEEMLKMMQHGILLPDRIVHEKHIDNEDHSQHSMTHDDPNSVLLEPKETGEIVWQFPQKTTLEFACNIPGHYEAGMVGKFIWY